MGAKTYSARVLLSLGIVLLAAQLGGRLARRLGQPGVLGELLAGIALGAVPQLAQLKTEPALEVLSELGVLVLLFQVGLESSVGAMWKVGASSLRVAALGVVAPFALGWGVSGVLLPGQSTYVHAFIGATLSATSVGITARVLKDLRRSDAVESRIILGAAVIDDVLGLLVLAVVTGLITAANDGVPLAATSIALLVVKAVGFLIGAVCLGLGLQKHVSEGPVIALLWCLAMAWVAQVVGLSPIVGAFAAGLTLESEKLVRTIEPIGQFVVPFFFVKMGLSTQLSTFMHGDVLVLAAALTAAAILGKAISGLAAKERRLDVVTLGIGMIPRGEVGLIFASVGLTLQLRGTPVIDGRLYAAIVAMVLATTLVTPPALKWSLARAKR